MTTGYFHRPRRGVMLLIVLWIVTLLSLLAYSIIYQMTLETRLTSVRKKTVAAKAAARAGLAKGFADLRNDLINDLSEEVDQFDSEGDYWAVSEEDKTEVELANGALFTTIVEDDHRYFDLNQMNGTNRLLLQEIIEMIGYEEEDAKVVASAIIDYADPDDTPVLDTSSGDEGDSYAMIQAENEGERVREDDVVPLIFPNEPYRTVEQLLDVYGVTPELYFGPGTEEAEYFRAEMSLGEQARRGKPFIIRERRRGRDEEVYGLKDFFTVAPTRELNINTAPAHVLEAYFRAGGRDDGDRLADRIIKQRRGGKSRRIDKDDAYKSVQEVGADGEMASILGALTAIHPLGVRSSYFTLTSTGSVGDVRQTLSVSVRRELQQFQVDETFESIDRSADQEYDQGRRDRQSGDDDLSVQNAAIYITQWNPSPSEPIRIED